MTNIFLLEDDPKRRAWFVTRSIGCSLDVTDSIAEAKQMLRSKSYDQIFLDHDLSDEHYAVWQEGSDKHDATTGYAIAAFLADNPDLSKDAQIVIHSLNPVGSERMANKLKESRQNVARIPFLDLMLIQQ